MGQKKRLGFTTLLQAIAHHECKKIEKNLQGSDILSIFAGVNSIVELKQNYNEKEKTIKCKQVISRKYPRLRVKKTLFSC